MFSFLKRLLWDESAFERYGRATLGAGALAIATSGGIPTTKKEWFSALAIFIALLVGSGQKNDSLEKLKEKLSLLPVKE